MAAMCYHLGMNLKSPVHYSWKQIFQSNLKYLFLSTIVFLIVFQQINLHMLVFFQHRSESIIPFHPLINFITPRPIGTELNIFFYLTLFISLLYFLAKPKMLLIVTHALLLMWMVRWLTMYLLPLATPPHKVPLHDIIAYAHYFISRDLFFSGHTAMLVIILCAIKNRWLFIYAFVMTIVIIALLLVGHQHYLLDIICAPFFAVICYQVSVKFSQFAVPLLLKNKAVSGPEVTGEVAE